MLKCISNILDEDEMPPLFVIRAAGLITNQAAYTAWYEDQLLIPSELFKDQDKADPSQEV